MRAGGALAGRKGSCAGSKGIRESAEEGISSMLCMHGIMKE